VAPPTLRTAQIRDNAVTAGKIALDSGSFHFSGSATLRAPSSSPSDALDVASKGYVDAVAQGLRWKEPARVATTANLPGHTYNNGSSGVGATLTAGVNGAVSIDSTALALNDRVLVWKQTAGAENGIYRVSTVGDAGTPAVLTRTEDADTSAELSGAAIFVASGSAGDTGFVLSTDGSLTIGTTSLSFVAFTGASAVSAGNGLSKSGSTLSVKLNASTPGLVVDADGLTVKIKADSGVVKDADGLSVGLAALGGIGLVGGLLAVQVTEGVEIDGSGNLKINLDGGTLAQGADGLKVASDGISGAELAVRPRFDSFTGDGSTTVFTLANSVHANHLDGVKAFVNGMRVKPVASAPADEWEYVVADDEGDTIITFGAAPATGDLIFVDSISG
jgi:hypothetical protein